VSGVLTDLLGQPVVIDGDVHLSQSPQLAVVATGLRLPAEAFSGVDLAKLDLVRFPVLIGNILRGGISVPEIEARGLAVYLLERKDGATTWVKPDVDKQPQSTATGASEQTDMMAFLGEREIDFSDMRVRAANSNTGFEFDFELDEFRIEQGTPGKDDSVHVRSGGRVNEQPITFAGEFPKDAPFEAQGSLGGLTFTVEGEKPPGASRGDVDATLRLETTDTQNLLNLLRLEGNLAATARAEVEIIRRNTHLDMEDIDLQIRHVTGATAQLTGRFADVRFGHDFDLSLLVDFIGENRPPPPAIFFKDMQAKSAEVRVLGSGGNIEIGRLALKTNAFDEEIRDIGPFRVRSVSRSETGQLKLDGVELVIGPEDKPYLLAEGNVDSLLTFEGYRVTGALDLPAQRVLLTLKPDEAQRFGRLTGSMRLQETNGEPDLQLFELRSQDTDLWHADLSLKSADLDDFGDLELNAKISTQDGSKLLEAMRLEPVGIGFMGLEVNAAHRDNELVTEAVLSAGQTTLETNLSLRVLGSGPVLRGQIRSEKVRLEDARNNILALVQLSRLRSVYSESRSTAQAKNADEFQPLVLPGTAQTEPETEQSHEDLSDFEPLVLPDTGPDSAAQEDVSDFQPLVLSNGPADLAIRDVLDPEQFTRLIDAEIGIDISRITGQEGVSSLKSQLQMKMGKLRLGPLRLTYGKGYADLTSTIDAIGAPDKLRINGRTGGWDFGSVLESLGVDIGAHGTLSGRFDLTGERKSTMAFARSMRGQATIDLVDGRIDTGLIELAGLGVLPWLFSQERRQGFAQIVCLKAPLEIANGRLSTHQTVMETPRVQLVGSGTIDIRANSISFVAEPRPVGQPLSRSAWPIEISGSLKSPEIKIAKRKTRRALVPLAMAGTRALCVPDISQLQQTTGQEIRSGPR
jgi:uncharacterized protein involved in outer membrane biogenesis